MKVLVTGYNGQLGFDVVKEGQKRNLDMIGIGFEDLDITKKDDVIAFVKNVKPDAIIHCAAYTAVDKAEEQKELAWDVNVNGTRYLAELAAEIGSKFMYISTDYVYNGEGDTPFKETSPVEPQSYYGLTKFEGEKVCQQLLNELFIVRISWVFGTNGHNFINTMLRLSESRDELSVVDDQIGSPTYTYDLARLLVDMIITDKYGVYQATNEGYCSWADFALEIFAQANRDVKVNKITSEEYPTPAARPKNSRMSKKKLIEMGFEPLPHWKEALSHYLKELDQEVNV